MRIKNKSDGSVEVSFNNEPSKEEKQFALRWEVLRLLRFGWTRAEIGNKLSLKTHVVNRLFSAALDDQMKIEKSQEFYRVVRSIAGMPDHIEMAGHREIIDAAISVLKKHGYRVSNSPVSVGR